jgi:hypothetical protein
VWPEGLGKFKISRHRVSNLLPSGSQLGCISKLISTCTCDLGHFVAKAVSFHASVILLPFGADCCHIPAECELNLEAYSALWFVVAWHGMDIHGVATQVRSVTYSLAWLIMSM